MAERCPPLPQDRIRKTSTRAIGLTGREPQGETENDCLHTGRAVMMFGQARNVSRWPGEDLTHIENPHAPAVELCLNRGAPVPECTR